MRVVESPAGRRLEKRKRTPAALGSGSGIQRAGGQRFAHSCYPRSDSSRTFEFPYPFVVLPLFAKQFKALQTWAMHQYHPGSISKHGPQALPRTRWDSVSGAVAAPQPVNVGPCPRLHVGHCCHLSSPPLWLVSPTSAFHL